MLNVRQDLREPQTPPLHSLLPILPRRLPSCLFNAQVNETYVRLVPARWETKVRLITRCFTPTSPRLTPGSDVKITERKWQYARECQPISPYPRMGRSPGPRPLSTANRSRKGISRSLIGGVADMIATTDGLAHTQEALLATSRGLLEGYVSTSGTRAGGGEGDSPIFFVFYLRFAALSAVSVHGGPTACSGE